MGPHSLLSCIHAPRGAGLVCFLPSVSASGIPVLLTDSSSAHRNVSSCHIPVATNKMTTGRISTYCKLNYRFTDRQYRWWCSSNVPVSLLLPIVSRSALPHHRCVLVVDQEVFLTASPSGAPMTGFLGILPSHGCSSPCSSSVLLAPWFISFTVT